MKMNWNEQCLRCRHFSIQIEFERNRSWRCVLLAHTLYMEKGSKNAYMDRTCPNIVHLSWSLDVRLIHQTSACVRFEFVSFSLWMGYIHGSYATPSATHAIYDTVYIQIILIARTRYAQLPSSYCLVQSNCLSGLLSKQEKKNILQFLSEEKIQMQTQTSNY